MRNLVEYPLTGVEILKALENAIEDQRSKRTIGGTDGMSLHIVKSYLEMHPEALEEIVSLAKVE